MPTFQQLLFGSAQRIAKRQAELDALARGAAEAEAAAPAVHPKIAELQAAAQAHFAQPGVAPPPPMTLLHGTPYKFDRFDFENNLRRGEGALAYGPGGYMTGHEPLAREYARRLFAQHSGQGSDDPYAYHRPLREALATDPVGAAEYLRAVTMQKLAPWADRAANHPYASLGPINPRSAQARKLEDAGIPVFDIRPSGYHDPRQFLGERTITASDFDEYRRAADLAGLPLGTLKTRIGLGGVSPLEAIRQGREIQRAVSAAPEIIRPKLSESFAVDPRYFEDPGFRDNEPDWKTIRDLNYARYGTRDSWESGAPYGEPSGFTKSRANLNSTARVIEGRPGRAGYFASMDPGGRIDMRQPLRPGGPPNTTELARRLYSAPFNASFADMLPYDYPISSMTPEKLGALGQLAMQHGFINQLRPDMPGSEIIKQLRDRISGGDAERMRALRDAGFPATFFLRGGRRATLPTRINPEDFNFVIHDQSLLGDPNVEEFAAGGAV